MTYQMEEPEPQSNPKQRARNIAEELAYDILTRTGADDIYRFRLGNKAVKLVLTFEFSSSTDLDKMYIAVNPPGTACSCCGGSGKTKSTPPHASSTDWNEA